MAGRRPTPTALRLIRGNPSKRPINKDEPAPPVEVPDPPACLTPVAVEEWQRVSGLLVALGMMTQIDRSGLAAYCQAYARWVEAEESLAKRGTIVKTKAGNVIQNPYLAVANKAMDNMRKFLIEFGMTPASRSRVVAGRKADPEG